MKASEYFGDWIKVIDIQELSKILSWLKTVDNDTLCPDIKNIFKAFRICPYKECKVVFLGLDPYPQKGVATGILFGNKSNTPEDCISPSLSIIKEAAIDYTIPHGRIEFDNTLESWAEQGILMLNSALTCKVNSVGSHSYIWKEFMVRLVNNLSSRENNLVFVLFGKQAQSFKPFIEGSHKIIEVYHPAYYARINKPMPTSVFRDVNKYLKDIYNTEITFYGEYM